MARKRLRARVKADGSVATAPIWYFPTDPETGKPYEADETGQPGVRIRLRYVSPPEYRRVIIAHTSTKLDQETKQLVEVSDNAAIGDAVVQMAIQEWVGIDDADGNPLPCTDPIKLAIVDIRQRAEIQYLATRTLTAVEVPVHDASFRESA